MTKNIESAFDVGLGLIILVLVMTTAFIGLNKYSKTSINIELQDKNSNNIKSGVQALSEADTMQTDVTLNSIETWNDGPQKTAVEECLTAILACAANKDNIRAVEFTVKDYLDRKDRVVTRRCVDVSNLYILRTFLIDTIKIYENSWNQVYGTHRVYNLTVIQEHSRITCLVTAVDAY